MGLGKTSHRFLKLEAHGAAVTCMFREFISECVDRAQKRRIGIPTEPQEYV